MFGKRKDKELSAEQKEWLERIGILRERVHQLDSDVNLAYITERKKIETASQIIKDLEKLEREVNGFDEMMGNPIDFLEEIFK